MGYVKHVERLGRYITVRSASQRSGLSERTIIYLTQVGHVVAVKFGGCLGVEMGSLDEYIANRRKPEGERSGEE